MRKANECPTRGKGNGDRAVIDRVAEGLVDPGTGDLDERAVHSPTSAAGEPIEQQVRKEWDPKKKGGLPTFFK
jgi:hypothetical protein